MQSGEQNMASDIRRPLKRGRWWTALTVWLLPCLLILAASAQMARADDNTGPVRMARFSYLSGNVTWRNGTDTDWSAAVRNMPLHQGAQIWTADNSRVEIQFDDGSRVRLDQNTLITLQTLYSDNQGEFTEITLNDGEVAMRLNNQYSLYQVNTPLASLKAVGPARVRVGAGDGAQFGVVGGEATVEGSNGKVTLSSNQYMDLVDNSSPYNVGPMPQSDAWDAWNIKRDQAEDNPDRGRYLPSNIALVCDDLEHYGTWHHDPGYGWVWAPTVTDPEWRPYGAGSWTWVEPFGWTWVSAEPWGWAPYHYGTWVHADYGWAWAPGPAVQYWSPAVVSFYQVDGRMAWVPLAPREVVYPPTLAIGFAGGNWSLFFSIGSAAVFYPGARGVFEPHPWANGFVNHVTVVNVTNVTVNHNVFVQNANFVSVNARFGGASIVGVQEFGTHVAYEHVPAGQVGIFANAHLLGAPGPGEHPIMGPPVRPTAAAFTPTHTFVGRPPIPQEVVNKSVYRASLPANVARNQTVLPGQHFVNSGSRSGSPFRPNSGASANNGNTGSNGHSSGLDEYLRDRQNRNNGNGNAGNGGNGNGSSPNNGHNTESGGSTHTNNSGSSSSGSGSHNGSPFGSYRPLHGGSSHSSGGSSGHSGDSSKDKSDKEHDHH